MGLLAFFRHSSSPAFASLFIAVDALEAQGAALFRLQGTVLRNYRQARHVGERIVSHPRVLPSGHATRTVSDPIKGLFDMK
jgi:hypothetical protein